MKTVKIVAGAAGFVMMLVLGMALAGGLETLRALPGTQDQAPRTVELPRQPSLQDDPDYRTFEQWQTVWRAAGYEVTEVTPAGSCGRAGVEAYGAEFSLLVAECNYDRWPEALQQVRSDGSGYLVTSANWVFTFQLYSDAEQFVAGWNSTSPGPDLHVEQV